MGVAGTGMLGGAVALRLLGCGIPVCVYNRTAAGTDGAAGAGAAVAGTPAELARASDLVLIIVRDAEAVEQVSFGPGGIAEGAHEGLAVADMSTITPDESRRITARFLEHGIRKLDCPVMGGPPAAAEGRLVAMCSGDEGAYGAFGPVLEAVATESFHLGPPGAAHAVKLAMNLQIAMTALALSEGITLAGSSGVDPRRFLEVLNSTHFATGTSRKKAFGMVDGDHAATFTLANLEKDIAAMTRTARGLGITLPMAERARGLYADAVAAGLGGIDYTGIIEHVRRMNSR